VVDVKLTIRPVVSKVTGRDGPPFLVTEMIVAARSGNRKKVVTRTQEIAPLWASGATAEEVVIWTDVAERMDAMVKVPLFAELAAPENVICCPSRAGYIPDRPVIVATVPVVEITEAALPLSVFAAWVTTKFVVVYSS
jgi:hypothetical protein